MPVHFTAPLARSRPSYTFAAEADGFHSVLMSSRFTKKSLVSVSGRRVRTAVFGLPEVGVQGAHAADENRHLWSGQRQHVCPLHQQLLRRFSVSGSEVVAKPVRYQGSHHSRWPFF